MTGRCRCRSTAPRKSKPHHSGSEKFVAPLLEMTPVALAGPGVSRPTASTDAAGTPATSSASAMAAPIASRAATGPVADAARRLDHVIDQEHTVVGEHRRVRLGAADIEPDDDGS